MSMLQLFEHDGVKIFGRKTKTGAILFCWDNTEKMVSIDDVKVLNKRVNIETVKRMQKFTTANKTTFEQLALKWINTNQSSRRIASLLDISNTTALSILEAFGLKDKLHETTVKRNIGFSGFNNSHSIGARL